MWQFTSPREIIFGEGALEYLEELEGERALVIAGETLRRMGIIDRVKEALEEADIEVIVFDQVEPEPGMETVRRGARMALDQCPDWIVGLGGGSSMDAAKAIWTLYERPDLDVGDISPLEYLDLRRRARLMLIPTTSGSGSETNWATVITDTDGRAKMELASRELVPDLVISDPSLAVTMPPSLTARTGMDALAHAIESYASSWRNDFSDALAMKAIATIFQYLPDAYADPEDEEARERMHNAATMAGWAFGNSHVGMAHALGHAMGAIFGIDHGEVVALFLPHVIRYNGEEIAERYGEILDALDIGFEFEEDAPNILAQAIVELMNDLGLACDLCALGIDKDQFEAELENVVERALMSTSNLANPRSTGGDDYREMLVVSYQLEDR
jgi:alcohol dehydrogenase class IV